MDHMHIVPGCDRFVAMWGTKPRPLALAIGNFDGVHRGHQALLQAAVQAAKALGGSPGVLTFDPHPARFFAPHLSPPMLLPIARRIALLGEYGAAFVIVEPFDAPLSGLSPEAFVQDMLIGKLGVGHVVVGYDFSFGRGRQGSGATLVAMGQRHGFGVTIVPPVAVNGLTCSSTKIREFLLEGRVQGATLLLGRPPELHGVVVQGQGRGRGIGVPTANLKGAVDVVLRPGVYAGHAVLADGRRFAAAINIGTNPTFVPAQNAPPPLTVEAHLLDFSGDLYGQPLRLDIMARLRDERRFAAVADLVAQIHQDIQHTRELTKP